MKRSVVRIALPLLLSLTAACKSATGPGPLLDALPRPLTASEQAVLESSNAFAFDLFRRLSGGPDRNVIVSPLSVSMSLGMTMNGAAGETWEEMRAGLRFDELSQGEINASYRGLMDLLGDLDPATEMRVANSIWYREGFPFEQSFFETVAGSFDAEVSALDFGSSASVDRVNRWVRDRTGGRIPTILEKIGRDDVMYLINAIYFKGEWREQFDPSRTTAAQFRTLDGRDVPVQMMSADRTIRYAWAPDFQAVDLPYGNGAFTMTVLLPREGKTVEEIVAQLDAGRWSETVDGFVEQRLMLQMPRFRLEYEKELNQALMELGIERAFQPGGADFSRMSAQAGTDLYISAVLHKTFVEVDEKGTEAAAATKTTIGVVSAPPQVRIDRPFAFAIRERFSGAILFLGRVGDPTAG
ncbi:MAG TPA: serpin family protein [Longimicrobiaceae bacterium]|nr:serpin family protein [Longimicrobiaceae bacterium]